MEEKFIKWTDKDIRSETESNKRKYQHIKNCVRSYELDLGKENRKVSMQCKYCYYLRICEFSAMTTSYCGICKELIFNGSCATDKICDKCAGTKGLCVHCGGEMD